MTKQIVEIVSATGKNGEVLYSASVLTPVLKYGDIRTGLVTVSLTPEQFDTLKNAKVGDKFPFDIVFPESQYSCRAI